MKKIILFFVSFILIGCSNTQVKKDNILYKIKKNSELERKIEYYSYVFDKDKNKNSPSLGKLHFIIENNNIEEIYFLSDYKKLENNTINFYFNFKNNIIFLYGPSKCSVDIETLQYKPYHNLTSVGWEITKECPRVKDIILGIEHLKNILKTHLDINYDDLKKQDF